MKIILMGDLHISSTPPSSRKETPEEFRDTQLNKLKEAYSFAENEDDIVILTGDVFHSSALSMMSGTPKFYNDVIDILNSRQTYTIVGNHDMYFRNENSENTTILDNILKTRVKKLNYLSIPTNVILENGPIKSIEIYGVDYGNPYIKHDLREDSSYNILVAHAFFEDSFFGSEGNSNITSEDIVTLGKNESIVLGHDHTPYDTVRVTNSATINGTTSVFRPGSMLRGTSHTCQVNRIPRVLIFDTNTLTFEYKDITNVPGSEIFKEKVILEKDLDLNLESLLSDIDSFDKSVSIYEFISKNEEKGREVYKDRYDKIIDTIKTYLNSYGFIGG